MMKKYFPILMLLIATLPAFAQQPKLEAIRFNLYTDSIKPVLNYYVNVEGEFNDGRVLPLDNKAIILEADWGEIHNSEWVIPKRLEKECVVFTATARNNPELRKQITVYIQKRKDPRDEE